MTDTAIPWSLKTYSWVSKTLLILMVSLWSVSCGPSYEETRAKKQKEREAITKQLDRERSERLSRVGSKFAAIEFPPPSIRPDAFTLELQSFLRHIAGRPLVFDAFLEDVEETAAGVILTASRPLHDTYPANKVLVLFRLKIDTEKAQNVLAELRRSRRYSGRDRLSRLLGRVDSLIVAQVDSFSSIKRYETRGSAQGRDDVELSIESPSRFLAEGRLLEFAVIPDEKRDRIRSR